MGKEKKGCSTKEEDFRKNNTNQSGNERTYKDKESFKRKIVIPDNTPM